MLGSVIVIPWAGGEDDVEDMDLVGVMEGAFSAYWDRRVVGLTALFVPLVGICSFSEVELRNSFEKGVQLFFRVMDLSPYRVEYANLRIRTELFF